MAAARDPRPAAVESEFFDDLVRREGSFNPFADRGWETLRKRFEEATRDLGARRRLLDVGCGTGESRRVYRSWPGTATGVDLSVGALAAARAAVPGRAWLAADAFRLPFPSGSFDVVAFSSVLHHLPALGPALDEARRLLRDGGRVFAFDPNLRHPAMWLFRNPDSPLYSPKGVSPNERPLHPERLRQAVAGAGFVDVGIRCQSDIPYRRVAPRLLDAALGIYNAVDRLWEVSGLGRRWGTFVVTTGTAGSDPEGDR